MDAETAEKMGAKVIQFVPPPVEIPEQKRKEMQAYAKILMVRHPGWDLKKVQDRTARHFNIKFV